MHGAGRPPVNVIVADADIGCPLADTHGFLSYIRIHERVLYHFELQMAGVILFSAMIAGGILMWYRRRKQSAEDAELDPNNSIQND